MASRIGVVTFPGTCDDRDALRAVEICGGEPVSLWHKDDGRMVHQVWGACLWGVEYHGGVSEPDLRCLLVDGGLALLLKEN